jgi:hypothetical protein
MRRSDVRFIPRKADIRRVDWNVCSEPKAEACSAALSGLTLMCILGCSLWLWTITRELNRINRLSVENNKELDGRG